MSDITQAIREMADMDELAAGHSPIHRLHPLVKLITTVAYIFTVVSFSKENLSGLIPMVLLPMILFSVSGIPVRVCFYKLRVVLPLVCAVGIWNPILDRTPVMKVGALIITAGMITFLSLMLKGVFALMASFLLIATTGIEGICYALSVLHLPDILVTQVLITYRYIDLLLSEAGTMMHAYALRAPGQKGVHISAWGSFLGQLLLRSMDRARDLYQSMVLRGFTGSFNYVAGKKAEGKDYLYLLLVALYLVIFRMVNISVLLGSGILGY